MLKAILLVLLLVGSAGGGRYTGPSSLGPFSLDKPTHLQRLYNEVGRPRDPGADHFCYKGSAGSYMWATKMAHRPAEIGNVAVSVFPNCMGEAFTSTPLDFRRWKTPQGIGLGSPERAILKAYGPPSDRYQTAESRYGYTSLYGSTDAYGHSRPLPPEISSWVIGSQVLVYGHPEDDLRVAYFGLREGRVIWIFLNDSP